MADDIEATLKASEISRDRVEDARNVLKEGEEIEAKIISVDRKSRVISLSIKSKDDAEEREAIQSLKTPLRKLLPTPPWLRCCAKRWPSRTKFCLIGKRATSVALLCLSENKQIPPSRREPLL